ncbi:MAG: hypothetical protein ACI4E5_10800 [Suilimivivens sp.]
MPEVLKNAYRRVKMLAKQEQAEFDKWVRYILLSVCGDKEAVLDEILVQSGNGEEDMAFKYNIIKMFEDERAEGKAEDILDLLEEHEAVPEDLRKQILEQKDLVILRKWMKLASGVNNIQEFIQRM